LCTRRTKIRPRNEVYTRRRHPSTRCGRSRQALLPLDALVVRSPALRSRANEALDRPTPFDPALLQDTSRCASLTQGIRLAARVQATPVIIACRLNSPSRYQALCPSMRFAYSPRFPTLTRGRQGIRLAARAPATPVIIPRGPACHERAQRVEWRRRELHPRPEKLW
jgi:hypothetical protein